jgi:hypothetical protein
MARRKTRVPALVGATALATSLLVAAPAHGQDAAQIDAIQRQIQDLQAQLRQLRQQAAARDAALRRAQDEAAAARAEAARATARLAQTPPAPVAPPPRAAPSVTASAPSPTPFPAAPAQPPSLAGSSPQAIVGTTVDDRPNPTFQLGGVRVTLGGFVELAGVFRAKNETADIGTSWNGIPYAQSPNAHTSEFRETEHQSRLSLLVDGKPSDTSDVQAYFEADLNAAAPTANSQESNSYNPRIRQAYATYDESSLGLHVLAGQAWSLITPFSSGLTPRKEQIPLTIDSNYIPGFTWLRVPQVRITKDFDQKYWVGLSLETPQTLYNFNTATGGALPTGIGAESGATVTYTNTGGSGYSSTNSYSIDVAPDIILKAAADPGYGHYEAYGVGRFFKDRLSGPTPGTGNGRTVFAGGVGGGATIPVVRGILDFGANVLAGYGIGRYGSGQLPDATIKADGSPAPLPEIEAMLGLTAHPIPAVDLYSYVGVEQVGRKYFTAGGKGYGYGSPLFVNTGCDAEISTATCTGNTRQLTQGAIGAWWRFLHGNFGTLMTGFEYSYTRRDAFRGVGGAPHAQEQVGLVSLRYLPFQ